MSQGLRPPSTAQLALVLSLLSSIIVLDATKTLAGPPPLSDDRLGIGTAPLLLLSRPDVRAELALDARQAADADRILNELYQQAFALKGRHGPDALERKRAIDGTAEQWIETHLSEAQRKRFSQLDLQWEGASALIKRPVVADHLRLNDTQRAQLKAAIAARDQRRSQGADLWDCERQLFEQTRTLLTSDQRQRWRAMLGPPFAFTRQHAETQPQPGP